MAVIQGCRKSCLGTQGLSSTGWACPVCCTDCTTHRNCTRGLWTSRYSEPREAMACGSSDARIRRAVREDEKLKSTCCKFLCLQAWLSGLGLEWLNSWQPSISRHVPLGDWVCGLGRIYTHFQQLLIEGAEYRCGSHREEQEMQSSVVYHELAIFGKEGHISDFSKMLMRYKSS